jgi:hypothetical protein
MLFNFSFDLTLMKIFKIEDPAPLSMWRGEAEALKIRVPAGCPKVQRTPWETPLERWLHANSQ